MRPSLTATVSNFRQGPFVSFEDRTSRAGYGISSGETRRPRCGNIQTFVKRFLAATCRNRPRQIGWRGKNRDRAFGVSVYMSHRWLLRSESLSSLFAQGLANSRAQDFSITRNETTRLRPKTRRRNGLNGIIHSGRGE